ncbi:MAG TPA: hypothetical protein VJB57_11785 [Dehalococcoidia bacterium]|nr:hypothetical protein [Dehalococcoidia bacterium]
MIDPLRLSIEEALLRELNPIKFQKCAIELLSTIYPSLVLISGGQDFGRDGLVAPASGSSFPIVCTTSNRVLENLRGSLSRYAAYGAKGGPVVVATSTRITPLRQQHLEEAAQEHRLERSQAAKPRKLGMRLSAAAASHA